MLFFIKESCKPNHTIFRTNCKLTLSTFTRLQFLQGINSKPNYNVARKYYQRSQLQLLYGKIVNHSLTHKHPIHPNIRDIVVKKKKPKATCVNIYISF